jgi:hypothetical protein
MDRPSLKRLLLSVVSVQGLLVAAVAVFLTVNSTDAIVPLVTFVLVWSLLAAAFLRRFAEPPPQMTSTSLALITWGVSRFTLLVASFALLTCWLVSLALDLDARSMFFGATLLVILSMGIVSFIGGALLILVRTARRWRLRESE